MGLNRITIPTLVTGVITDHLMPWKGRYRTTELASGPSAFVLSNAGHIASPVDPGRSLWRRITLTASPRPAWTPGSSRPPSAPGNGGRSGRTERSSARGRKCRRRRSSAAVPTRHFKQAPTSTDGKAAAWPNQRQQGQMLHGPSPYPERNSPTSAALASGRSSIQRWPPCGISSSGAWGIRRASI